MAKSKRKRNTLDRKTPKDLVNTHANELPSRISLLSLDIIFEVTNITADIAFIYLIVLIFPDSQTLEPY